jgi:glycosyltransferase involved in cell wall biosynthesis
MAAAKLSIIVPTPDGDGLIALFESVLGQLLPADELLVIGDGFWGPLTHVAALCLDAGPPVRYLSHNAGYAAWGHPQINYGITQASGDYLIFIDDDDQFAPDALATIRQAIGELSAPRPLIFRFYAQRLGRTLPEQHAVIESGIGGHCLVQPNIPDRLGRWEDRYGGDFDFIVSTLAHWPEGPVWRDDVIAIAR